MKNLLAIAFIVTTLCACGGEFKHQDSASTNKALPTEQSAMQTAAAEKKEANNKRAAEATKETTKQDAADTKTDSAIEMVMGVAKSMY